MTVVVVGKNSFIAAAIRDVAPDWVYLSHDEAFENTEWVSRASCVINCALHPGLRREEYNPDFDIDAQLARLILAHPVHYMMLSSRMAYGTGENFFGLTEDMPPGTLNQYGRNKLTTEKALAEILPEERLTILRMANVFGFEKGRRSFMGQMLQSLSEDKKIIFDMHPETIRDFIPVGYVAKALVFITENLKAGLYNLGSGFGISCGELATSIIEGYGEGELICVDPQKSDQFWLDMRKANNAFSLPAISKDQLKLECVGYGQRLK